MPLDTVPYGHRDGIAAIRDWFFKAEWWAVYNLIEFLFQISGNDFCDRVTVFLEREKTGYILGNQLVPITDPVELSAVSEAAIEFRRG